MADETEMSEQELDAELREFGIDPDNLLTGIFQQLFDALKEKSALVLTQAQEISKLKAELESADESLEAQITKYEGCPHEIAVGVTCGCSLDHPSDICAFHAPQLAKAQQEIAELRQELDITKETINRLAGGGVEGYTEYCKTRKSMEVVRETAHGE